MSIPPITSSISSAPRAPQTSKAPAAANAPVTQAQSGAAAALKAMSAAVQEAHESPTQTMKEAASGDRQAQKLLHHNTPTNASRLGGTVDTKA